MLYKLPTRSTRALQEIHVVLLAVIIQSFLLDYRAIKVTQCITFQRE